MTDRHPNIVLGAIEERIDAMYDAAMRDSTPEIHEHRNRLDELVTELKDAIVRRELECSMAMRGTE